MVTHSLGYFKPSTSRLVVTDQEGERFSRTRQVSAARKAVQFSRRGCPARCTRTQPGALSPVFPCHSLEPIHHPFCRSVAQPTERPCEAERALVGRYWQESLVSTDILEEFQFLFLVRRMLCKCPKGPSLRTQASLDSKLLQGRNASYSRKGPQQPARPPTYIFVE